jgi:EAL domain-containing protein (putative c-di-GMP-specific phosphodiesterase class I)
MTGSNQENAGPALLLLSDNAGWTESTRAEAAALGIVWLLAVRDAPDALALLSGGQRFTHLLLHPAAADDLLPDLIGLTAGEAESGIATLLLGTGGDAARHLPGGGRATLVAAPTPGWLGPALALSEPAAAGLAAGLPLDDLLAALAAGRLQTRYQPVVRIADGLPIGLEVLARLEYPGLGTLPPDCFVPRIEAAGFATALARVVVRRAFADWRAGALPALGVRLGVNLPLEVLLLPGTAAHLEAWRAEAAIPPGSITVELTETHPVDRPDLLRPVLGVLGDAGYRLAIDDVGPAMANPDALFALPFTSMKLDKEVVRASAGSAAALRFIERAAAAARRAGLLVIAEGVETVADWARMERLGVDAAQGFLIARPLTAAAVAIWHAAWSRRRAA